MAEKELATLLITESREEIKAHLLSYKGNEYQSGYLTESDINQVELATGKKVECSVESGEYFYKLTA